MSSRGSARPSPRATPLPDRPRPTPVPLFTTSRTATPSAPATRPQSTAPLPPLTDDFYYVIQAAGDPRSRLFDRLGYIFTNTDDRGEDEYTQEESFISQDIDIFLSRASRDRLAGLTRDLWTRSPGFASLVSPSSVVVSFANRGPSRIGSR